MEQLIAEKVRLELASKRERPLAWLWFDYEEAAQKTFVEDGVSIVCRPHKFDSITQMNRLLCEVSKVGKIYVYKLYEMDYYNDKLKATRKKFYHLVYAVQEKEWQIQKNLVSAN